MNIIKILLVLLLIYSNNLYAWINNPDNLRGPEQYGVFYINEIPPQYFEDFYQLYNKRLYYNEDNIRVNLYYLKRALRSPFRHPSKALCLLKTKEEENRYRTLLEMHVTVKIMQNLMTLGALYDKKNIYYFNRPFKKDLIKSLNYAKSCYDKAKDYWEKVLNYTKKADQYKVRISIDYLEDEIYLINNRKREVDWEYKDIIDLHLNKLEENLKKLQ